MGGFADDWLGIDPNGGGIAGSLDNLIGTDLGIGGVQNDLYNGLKTIGTELTNFVDSGVDNIIATIGTVIPGPWTPFCVAYNIADNAANGNWVGAGLSAIGGYMALDAMNALGTAGATIDAAQTQAIMDAYQAAGYSTSESLNYVAQATGTSTSAVQAALNGGTLTAQGTGIIGTMQDLSNTVKDYLTSTGVTPTDSAIQKFAQTIKSDPSVLADFAEKTGTYLDASVLPEGFSPVAGVDAAVAAGGSVGGATGTGSGLWGSNMTLGDIGNTLGDMVKSGQLTESEAMQAMQAYNNAASSGSWADYLSTGAADDWASKSGLSLNDVFNTAKTANSVGNILKSLAGGAGNALSNLSTQDLSTLGSGGLAWYLANQYANKQENLANRMLTEADPYYEYRKNVETPARAAYAGLAPNLVNQAQATGQQAQGMLGDLFYQDKLKQSFTDPLAVYNTPEMQALNSQFLNGIERRDAAAGRNSQYGARALESQNNFLTNVLPTYRTGLNQGQTSLTNQGSALGNLFSQQGNFANNIANLGMAPSAGAGAGATAFGNIMTEANKNSTYGMNPLIYGANVAAGSTGSTGTNNLGSLFGLGNSIWNGIKDNISYSNVQDAMNSGIPSGADLADIANNSYNAAAAATNNWNTEGLDWFSGAF